MDILLTFAGFHDPFSKGLVGQEDQPGPILSLLHARQFDRVCLISTPTTTEITRATAEQIRDSHPSIGVETFHLDLEDPTDYDSILNGLRGYAGEIQDHTPSARLYVATASGTPQMHASWVLLAASGEVPATLLHIRPPRFVTKDRPLVTEIDLCAGVFPVVRQRLAAAPDAPGEVQELDVAIAQTGVVADHPTVRKAAETAAMLAPSNAPLLLLGETGTGKEVFARLIHRLSGRQRAPFVPVNCASIPENLVESILFGHKKGAFTGAAADQIGKFDAADRGTLFLDELGDLPLAAQAKLLRVLQDGLVEPIGAKTQHKVDVRVIAATNKDLRRQIREGKFREDLYYRLSVGEIKLPALRERRSDIPKLSLCILDRVNASLRMPKSLSPSALSRLQAHDWPGNVRDLENVIERSVRLSKSRVLDADDLLIGEPIASADPMDTLPTPHEGFSMEEFLGSVRKQLILRAIEAAEGNQSEAARLLGLTPQAVHKFIQSQKKT